MLHGFLGRPQDWNFLINDPKFEYVEFAIPDYFNIAELNPRQTLSDWGANFLQWKQSFSAWKDRPFSIIGYSMGGRLALQVLKQSNSELEKLFLISSAPGIDSGDKPARAVHDKTWANRFLNEDFKKTLESWNQQLIFRGPGEEPKRNEFDYDKKLLSLALTQWSQSVQENFLRSSDLNWQKVHWCFGEWDQKYIQIGQRIQQELKSPVIEIKNSGHRILFDQPEQLKFQVQELFKTVQ